MTFSIKTTKKLSTVSFFYLLCVRKSAKTIRAGVLGYSTGLRSWFTQILQYPKYAINSSPKLARTCTKAHSLFSLESREF